MMSDVDEQEIRRRRAAAVRTAWVLAVVALAVFIGYIVLWSSA